MWALALANRTPAAASGSRWPAGPPQPQSDRDPKASGPGKKATRHQQELMLRGHGCCRDAPGAPTGATAHVSPRHCPTGTATSPTLPGSVPRGSAH